MEFMKIILVLCFILKFNYVDGQDLLLKKNNQYFYQHSEYKCKELGEVYSAYDLALDLYTEGRAKKNIAKNRAILGLGLFTGGTAVGFAIKDLTHAAVGGAVLSGIILEIIAIATRVNGNKKLRKARKEFNYEMIRRHGYKDENSLHLGATQNGVGLVYQF